MFVHTSNCLLLIFGAEYHYRTYAQLQIMMPTLYMTVAQLSKLLEYFPPDEGYLRIQLIQSVFSHVVDLELMYQIYDNVLTVSERLEVGLFVLQIEYYEYQP